MSPAPHTRLESIKIWSSVFESSHLCKSPKRGVLCPQHFIDTSSVFTSLSLLSLSRDYAQVFSLRVLNSMQVFYRCLVSLAPCACLQPIIADSIFSLRVFASIPNFYQCMLFPVLTTRIKSVPDSVFRLGVELMHQFVNFQSSSKTKKPTCACVTSKK